MTTTEDNETHTPPESRPVSQDTLVFPPQIPTPDFSLFHHGLDAPQEQSADRSIGYGIAPPVKFQPKNGNVYTRFPLTDRQSQDQDNTLYAKNSRKFQEAWQTLNETEGVPSYMKTPQAEEMLKHVVTVNPFSLESGMTASQLQGHWYLKMLNPEFKLPKHHPYSGRKKSQAIDSPDQFAGLTASPYVGVGPTAEKDRRGTKGGMTMGVKVESGGQGDRTARLKRSRAMLMEGNAPGFMSQSDISNLSRAGSGNDQVMDEAPPVRQSSMKSKRRMAEMISQEDDSSEDEDADDDYGMIIFPA